MPDNKTITITKEDLATATANALASEPIAKLAGTNPILVLAFAVFSTQVMDELFKDDKEEE